MPSAHIPPLNPGDFRTLARLITAVENDPEGMEDYLMGLTAGPTRIIGITGPPGAGKSTVTDALTTELLARDHKIAILAIDPSSPFHRGALLGDRIRMGSHYSDPRVFIRSLATRGALGGLHPEIIGITTLVTSAGFDYLIIETVGVGQSEVEIAGLAHTTVVVLVPESGDDIQTMKAGVMEIGDIFVVNKADHSAADGLVLALGHLVRERSKKEPGWITPVLKTVATAPEGITALVEAIRRHETGADAEKRESKVMLGKALRLIENRRMRDLDTSRLEQMVTDYLQKGNRNLYRLVREFEGA